MRFYALLSSAGDSLVAEFPDCPGCVAVAGPSEDIGRNATAVLRTWLEARLLSGSLPPLPALSVPRRDGARARAIDVPPLLALRISTRHARLLRKQTTAEMGAALGLPEEQIRKLEHPAGEPSDVTIARMSVELGLRDLQRVRRTAPGRSRQRDLFPSQRSGSRSVPADVAAYDVRADTEHSIDLDVTFTAKPSLLERFQAASAETGIKLADWLLEAAREKLAREARDADETPEDVAQQRFSFVDGS